jgi:hypothetical protein
MHIEYCGEASRKDTIRKTKTYLGRLMLRWMLERYGMIWSGLI